MSQAAVKVVVSGLVQGVGYRYYAIGEARRLGLVGCVKNLPSGEVEAYAEGDRGLLEELLKALKIGPPSADVSGVQVEWQKPQGNYKRFGIEY